MFDVRSVLVVACGGAIGSTARFLLAAVVSHLMPLWQFPAATFFVNILGCFLAGCSFGLIERWGGVSSELRLLVLTGILGGFTTFSAFGVETITLLRKGSVGIAAAYVLASVAFTLGAVALGIVVTKPST